jgi:4-methylaminobutanoate oxidase (formaldehyde-forming)
VFGQTSFGKLLISGRDAEEVPQRPRAADVGVEPGRVVYTGMLDQRGGYEADVTVTRLSHQEYLLVTSSASAERDRDWITRRAELGQHVAVADVTSGSAVFGVMGPNSPRLLAKVSRAELPNATVPLGTSREIELGYATVHATRVTYVGELGWELCVPSEFAVGVCDLLLNAGRELGLSQGGCHAINSPRLDKG